MLDVVTSPIPARIRQPSLTETEPLLPALAEIMCDCVAGGAAVNFLAPLAPEASLAWWRGVLPDMLAGRRILLVAEDADGAPVGTVQLILAGQPNGAHRADVGKLLVHRRARGAGIGTALMRAVEAAAHAAGRTLLVLDTEAGSGAERLYRRLGWTAFGIVPGYALDTAGRPAAATFFHKPLGAA